MRQSGIPKTLVALLVLLQFSITEGKLEAYHRTGCDHVKSLKQPLRVLVQEAFSSALEAYYTASGVDSPSTKFLYIRLRKLAFREETANKQAIAILKIAYYKKKGGTKTVSFFVCLENCTVDAENNTFSFKLNTAHAPKPISGLTLCEESATAFENGGKWDYPIGSGLPNLDPKTNARHYIKKIAALGGIVGGAGAAAAATAVAAPVAAGIAAVIGLTAVAVSVAAPVLITDKRVNRSLLEKGYILFELTLVERDKKATEGQENRNTCTNHDGKTTKNEEGEITPTTDGEGTTNKEGDVKKAVSQPPRIWQLKAITKNEKELAETPKYIVNGKLYEKKSDPGLSH